jgi:hypothetical protein
MPLISGTTCADHSYDNPLEVWILIKIVTFQISGALIKNNITTLIQAVKQAYCVTNELLDMFHISVSLNWSIVADTDLLSHTCGQSGKSSSWLHSI